MYSQCPQCLTVFEIDLDALAARRGSVRCGHCSAIFNALDNVQQALPALPFERLQAHEDLDPPRLQRAVYRPQPPRSAATPTAREDAARTGAPAFIPRRSQKSAAGAVGFWRSASVLLLLALFAQVAWAERASWIDRAAVRNWLEPLCAELRCRLPLRHDQASLRLVSRDIRPHPSVAGALLISATLRNEAPFAQAFPTLKVTLSNLDEQRIAMRRFAPREYLGATWSPQEGIAAGASVALAFEVVDPGRNAVAFEFDFE